MTDPKPNAEAGKKMLADNGGVIDIDSDVLRRVAGDLQAHADALSLVKTTVARINTTVDGESGRFISEHAPKDVYSNAVGALKSVLAKFDSETEKAVTRLQTKAGALMWIADQHDSTETENRRRMDRIDPNVTAEGAPRVVTV